MITAKLGVGPLSPEIIEAVYRYSERTQRQMMLIASLNQVNATGGYVCGWNTYAYKQYCSTMKNKYPNSDVLICRDHCGPFFMGEASLSDSMDAVYANLVADCAAGFDLIHIDMCHYSKDRDEVLKATNDAMHFCQTLNRKMKFEVGTDAIGGVTDLAELQASITALECPVEFLVVNTGSLVREFRQAGTFDASNTKRCTDLLHKYGIKAKEHNADYLTFPEIRLRAVAGIDAMNVAPQFGKDQTKAILIASMLGDSQYLTDWLNEVYEARKWEKWTKHAEDKLHCVQCSGHYHFSGDNYERLRNVVDLSVETLIQSAMEVMQIYESNFDL